MRQEKKKAKAFLLQSNVLCLLPWWCGPLRRTQCTCRQSPPRWRQRGAPPGHDGGWCRWVTPCPKQQSNGPWSRWPSGRWRSAGGAQPRCGGSVCSAPRLTSPPTPYRGGAGRGEVAGGGGREGWANRVVASWGQRWWRGEMEENKKWNLVRKEKREMWDEKGVDDTKEDGINEGVRGGKWVRWRGEQIGKWGGTQGRGVKKKERGPLKIGKDRHVMGAREKEKQWRRQSVY